MDNNLYQGELVRLVAEDSQTIAECFSRWQRDSEYWRLLDSDPTRLPSPMRVKEWVEKELMKDPPDLFWFMIRTLEDDRLIGDTGLDGIRWSHGDAFVGIGVGERQYWNKGYGTDAMRIMLRFAFAELNLHRVTLNVFEYNRRAMRSYEKAGFTIEGRQRGWIHRDGKRYDLIYMGLLRSDWEASKDQKLDTVT